MIHLIRPPYRADSVCPPINLLSLAAYCEPHYAVSITDFVVPYVRKEMALDEAGVRKAARQLLENPAPVLGFTSMCNSHAVALRIAQECKRMDPSRFILFGGPHASFTDKESLEAFEFIDAIVVGEGEQTLLELLRALDEGRSFHEISGLTFRDGSQIIQTERRPALNDLDQLPFPAFHLVKDVDRYFEDEAVRFVEIEAGRGCPFNCSFCSTSLFFSRRYRVKSPQRILEEMRWLKQNWQVNSFGLIHDNLTSRREKVLDLCQFILESGERFEWFCSSRTDTIDQELMVAMKEAGCRGIFFGVETGSQEMQKSMGKRLRLDRTRETFRALTSVGIDATASFIIGWPEESLSQLEETLDMALEVRLLGIHEVQLHPLSPLPGTAILTEHQEHLQFHPHLLTFHDITSVIDITEVEVDWVQRYRGIFSNFYALPPHHYPLELVYQIRGCYFYLIHARPGTIYALSKLGQLRHTEIVQKLVTKLSPHYDQWTPPELLRSLEDLLRDLPEGIRQVIADIHSYETTVMSTARFTDGANGWVRYKGAAPLVYTGGDQEPRLKPAQAVALHYDVPQLLRLLGDAIYDHLPRRDLNLAIVLEWEGRRLRTLEVDPLTAEIITRVGNGESLPVCLDRLSFENPFLSNAAERAEWVAQVLQHLGKANLLVIPEGDALTLSPSAGV